MNRIVLAAALVLAPFVLAPWRTAKALAFGWLIAVVLLGFGSWVAGLLGFVCALTLAVAFGKKLGRAHDAVVEAKAEPEPPAEAGHVEVYGIGAEVADGQFALLLAFDRDGTDFVEGFEVGRVWTLAHSDADEVNEQVHSGNAEMVVRIAEATRRPFRAVPLNDDWLHVRMGAVDADDLDEDTPA